MNDIITKLRKLNIELHLVDSKLGIHAPEGNISKEVLDEIKQNKEALISYISQANQKNEQLQLKKIEPREYYKLSSAQNRLYYIYELDKSSLAYNITSALYLEGAIDDVKLNETFKKLINRHDIFRTSFEIINDVPVQKIFKDVDFEIEKIDLSMSPIDLIIKEFIRPFDLTKAPLIRVGLIEISSLEHILVIDLHHIISDGTTIGILIREFMKLYNDELLPLVKLSYSDFAEWQYSDSYKKKISQHKEFWLDTFSTTLLPLDLPQDFTRPAVMTYKADFVDFEISKEETEKLKLISEKQNASMFMTVLAIFNVLLSKLCNSEDITVGIPVSDRPNADLEDTIGMFVNTIAARNKVRGDVRFSDFLLSIKESTLKFFANKEYQYEELISNLNVERISGRNPLFDVMLSYQNFEMSELIIPGLKLKPYPLDQSIAKFDLVLSVNETPENIRFRFEYSMDILKKETVVRFAAYFKNILSTILVDDTKNLSAIEILSESEKHLLLNEFNATSVNFPKNKTIVDLFEEQVLRSPDDVAVVFGEQSLTYKELNEKSNCLAHYLKDTYDLKGDDIIGLIMDRSGWLLISILGVMKAGAAYLPIDKDYPASRKLYMIEDANLKLLICDSTTEDEMQYEYGVNVFSIDKEFEQLKNDQLTRQNLNKYAHTNNLVYVIYTSGSTGKPKGVAIEHNTLVNYILYGITNYKIRDSDACSFPLFTSLAFDLTQTSIFLTLLTGGELSVYSGNNYSKIISDILNNKKVNSIKLTPAHLHLFYGYTCSNLSQIIIGGEKLTHSDLVNIRTSNTHLNVYNEYGPTETTIGSSVSDISNFKEIKHITIGRPIANTQMYILDEAKNLSPISAAGELYISGAGVARGYLNNPSLTAEKFIPNPFIPGSRMYKTGDLARWLPDGTIDFLGRVDDQVKIRGFRIELEEISSLLCSYGRVRECVVIAREGSSGDKYLVAYYVSPEILDDALLKEYLSGKLPDYMVPAHYVFLESLPLTSNGKLDKKSLPAPETGKTNSYVAPVSKEEQLLAKVWSEVLGVEKVGVTDHFFSIGGDSIKSIQISSRMRSLGYELEVRDIMANPTIEKLSAKLIAITTQSLQHPVEGSSSLTPIQEWFFQGPIEPKHHFNQSVMLNFGRKVSSSLIRLVFEKIQQHHDALRSCFIRSEEGKIVQEIRPVNSDVFIDEDDFSNSPSALVDLSLRSAILQSSMDLKTGPLMKLGLYHLPTGSHLLIVIHHLVIDGVSWRILFEDIESLFQQHQSQKETLSLPFKTDSFQRWSTSFGGYRKHSPYAHAKNYWQKVTQQQVALLPRDMISEENTIADMSSHSFYLSKSETKQLLTKVHASFNTQINDLLLGAFSLAVQNQYGIHQLKIDLEGHGRESIQPDINIGRTIGWFTSIYPVILETVEDDLRRHVTGVKEKLRGVPNNGLDYLIYKYHDEDFNHSTIASRISFNYLGQFDSDLEGKSYTLVQGLKGDDVSLKAQRVHDWDVVGMIREGRLEMTLHYSNKQYKSEKIEQVVAAYKSSLLKLIDFCSQYSGVELTPSDLTYKSLSISELEKIQANYQLEDIYTLSPMQEGMLFHSLYDADSVSYFEQLSCQLNGPLNIALVEQTIHELSSRHAALRTIFLHEGHTRPLQVVLKETKINFSYKDISGECLKCPSKEIIASELAKDRAIKFDLSKDALMRILLLKKSAKEYELIWSHHHILMDGWCMSILVKEFKDIYSTRIKGEQLQLVSPSPYASYIEWMEKQDKEVSHAYWKTYLSGYETLSGLPKKPGTVAKNDQQKSHIVELNASETAQLRELSATYGVTLNTLIQCAWAIILSKYNNTNDVLFGSVVSGRPSEIPGIETMIGLFINTIPVRINHTDEETVESLLRKIQDNALESDRYSYHSLAQVQALSELNRELFDHLMIFENFPLVQQIEDSKAEDQDTHFKISDVQVFEQTNYDLVLMIVPGNTIQMRFNFNDYTYEEATIERISGHFHQLLSNFKKIVHSSVKAIEILSTEEMQQLLSSFNATEVAYPAEQTVLSLFQNQFEATPDHIAIRYGDETLTYADFNNVSYRVASYLVHNRSVQQGDLVGIMLERDLYFVPFIYGILLSGASYVPIDPNYPAERINRIIQQSGIRVLLTREDHLKTTINKCADTIDLNNSLAEILSFNKPFVPVIVRGDDLAYTIFTSGSTGTPKGVMIRHASLANVISCLQSLYPFHSGDSYLLKTNYCFDVSLAELFGWFHKGGSLTILPAGDEREPMRILDCIEKHSISHINFVPSMFSVFLTEIENNNKGKISTLKYIFLAGEALPVDLAERFNALNLSTLLVNIYGPTEGTIYSCGYTVGKTIELEKVPIGKPLHNIKLYILNSGQQLMPLGASGELYISGAGLAKGYLNDASLTAEKFISNPFIPDSRMYKTGDLASWLPDGTIEFLGRLDDQVKIRGFRIELEEISTCLRSYGGIREGVVLARESSSGDKYLVAYYASAEIIDDGLLKEHLSRELPDYMVPAHYVFLEALPLTTNGKLDKKSLPAPEAGKTNSYIAPVSREEQLLAKVWSEVLGVEKVGMTDHFFSIGGDSIKSIQISSRLRSLGYMLSVKDIMLNPTIPQLTVKLTTALNASSQELVVGSFSLSPIQEWFFQGPIEPKHHFNQSVMLNFPEGILFDQVYTIFEKIQQHHDALRSTFIVSEKGSIVQQIRSAELPVFIDEADLSTVLHPNDELEHRCKELQSGIDLKSGPLMRVGLYHMPAGTLLLLVIHHLIIDGISWRILFEDIENLYQQLKTGSKQLQLPLKTDSVQLWSESVARYKNNKDYEKGKLHWDDVVKQPVQTLPRSYQTGSNKLSDAKQAGFHLEKIETTQLLTNVHSSFNTQINDILLTALFIAVQENYGINRLKIDLESHGREDIAKGVDISRTIGWFTTIYPVILESEASDLKSTIKNIKENLRRIPNKGIDYLIYKYMDDGLSKAEIGAAISFNYLGQFDADLEGKSYSISGENKGSDASVNSVRLHDFDITGVIRENRLEMTLRYSTKQYDTTDIEKLMRSYKVHLLEIIQFCSQFERTELTVSDLSYKKLSNPELETLQRRYEIIDIYVLSSMQEGMLFHSLYDLDSAGYIEQITSQFNGVLNIQLVEKAMNELVNRHSVLRTVFLQEGFERPVQVVLKEKNIDFSYKDVTLECRSSSTEEVLESERRKDRIKKLDLTKDALIRLTVLKLSDNVYEFIWSFHHILMDGWCMGILVNEFRKIYLSYIHDTKLILPPAEPYSRYIEWIEKREKDVSKKYWENYLTGYENLSPLPKRPGFSTTVYQQKFHEFEIDQHTVESLQKLSSSVGVTLNTVLQCAWGILLSKYNNTNDVLFGAVVSGRPSEIAGIEGMIGLFINTIPVRINYEDAETINSLFKRIQFGALESDAHSYHSLAEIQSLTPLNGNLFDHLMVFENFPISEQIEEQNKTELNFSNIKGAVQTNYHFNVIVIPQKTLVIQFEFNGLCYDDSFVKRLSEQFETIIEAIVRDPHAKVSDLSLFDANQQAQLKELYTENLEDGWVVPTIQEQLQQSFSKHSVNCAMEYKGVHHTYAALEAQVNKIANTLINSKLPEGSTVGILCDDRYWLIASILGILKIRAVFVPLEVDLPEQRLISIINQSACDFIITDKPADFYDRLITADHTVLFLAVQNIGEDAHAGWQKEIQYHPDDAIYTYFTSGSTGNPKGVIGRNKGLSHFVDWEISTFHVDALQRFGQFTNPGFDVFLRDIFVPLCAGATICIPDELNLFSSQFITNWMDEHKITFIHCVPSLFRVFNNHQLTGNHFKTLSHILLAGEKINPFELENWYKLFNDRIQLVNVYGPTETTLAKGFYRIQPADYKRSFLPVQPIAGAQFLVFDRFMNLCPAEAIGTIYIRTPYRSKGYLNLAELNETSFVQNPFSKDRNDLIYKTGDIGKSYTNGELEIKGRTDHQVKIRGIRIELDDIKQNILKFDAIEQVVVTIKENEHGDKFVYAYFISSQKINTDALRTYLMTRLSISMIPSFFIQLATFPLTPNGKLNLNALPLYEASEVKEGAPENKTEETLLDIWAEVLKTDKSSIKTTTSFFNLGGHSLKVLNLIFHIQQVFSVKLTLFNLFQNKTIKEQARLILKERKDDIFTIERVGEKDFYQVSPAQERMYYQHLMNDNNVAFNISMVIKMHEHVNEEKIRKTFEMLIQRHESLRTGFILKDEGLFQWIREAVDFKLEHFEIANKQEIEHVFHDFIRPFDLAADCLIRAGIAYTNSLNENYLMIDIHHIIADGFSMNILIKEFIMIYEGIQPAPPNLRYIDYTSWIAKDSSILDQQRQFWLDKLSGELPAFELPVNQSSEESSAGHSARKVLEIKGDTYTRLKQFVAEANVSEFMFLLSVYYILLKKITGCSDIIIGTDVLGRTHPSLKDVVGTFVNILPLRMKVQSDKTFNEFLSDVRTCVLESFENQDFQFDQMVSLLASSQDRKNDPLVKVHLSFSNVIDVHVEERFEILPIENKISERKDYEFKLEVDDRNASMFISFVYHPSKFDAQIMQLLLEYYEGILSAVLENGEILLTDIHQKKSIPEEAI